MTSPCTGGVPNRDTGARKRRPRRARAVVVPLLVVLGGSLIPATASLGGAFPGANGKIAYSSYQAGNTDVYTLEADGTGATRLTTDTDIDSQPAVSPDGSKIAYATKQGGGAFEVYTMGSDGSGKTNVSSHTNADFDPTWSPDGTKIAFTSDRSGSVDVWVVDADGTNPVNLTSGVAAEDHEPTWSPDGSKIAFASKRSGNFDVWVMNADGTNPVNLTSSASGEDQWPTWSPDGSKIAFASKRSGNFDVWVMNADGSAASNLTSDVAVEDQEPAWSPDGTKIAFASKRSGNFDVWVMNSDGSSPVNYTSANSQEDHTPDWGAAMMPPPAPVLTATSPASPANENEPEISGSAQAGSTVTLYTDPTCLSAPAATGSAADFASPGLTVSVADNSTTTFYATATNAIGTSACSLSSIAYSEDSAAPESSITAGPSGPTADSTPSFSFGSDDPDAGFECRLDGGAWTACSSPETLGPLTDGPHTLEVRAVDSAGNADPSPASTSFTVDTAAPETQPDDSPGTQPDGSPGTQPDGSQAGPQPGAPLQLREPATEDLSTIPGNLAAADRCERLVRPARSRRVRVPRVGAVDVRMRGSAFVTRAQPVLLSVRGPSSLRRVRYLLDGRPLRGAARAPFRLALGPDALRTARRHVLTVRLAAGRGKARNLRLQLRTTACRSVFTAARRLTGATSRLKLRVDSLRSLRRIAFSAPASMLPTRAASRRVGQLTVRTAGGARKTYRLAFPSTGGRSLVRGAGAPRVVLGRGRITVDRLPVRAGIVGLTLHREGTPKTLRRARSAKLRARVVAADGVTLLSTKLRGR